MGDEKKRTEPILTPTCMLSYPHLDEPVLWEGNDEAKYSCCLVWDKDADLQPLKDAAVQAAQGLFGDKLKALIKNHDFKSPFKEDPERGEYPEGHTFVNCGSTKKPRCVYSYPGKDGKAAPVVNFEDLYAGCYVRAWLLPIAYNKGNKGVGFILLGIQKMRDGERIGGYTPDFDCVDGEEGVNPFDNVPAQTLAEEQRAAAAPQTAARPAAPAGKSDDPFGDD